MEKEVVPDECCPPFETERWHDKDFKWEDKLFVATTVNCFLHMPMNFGRKMRKLVPAIEVAGVSMPDGMVLAEHTSPWKMNLFIAVDKSVEGLDNVALSGNYYSKVYEGPYKDAGKWHKDFIAFLKGKSLKPGKIFFWYAYCPKCIKKYGKNYTTLIGEISAENV